MCCAPHALLVLLSLVLPDTPQTLGTESPSDERALPESVVTARKWEEEAAKVPASLSALDAEQLENAGLEDVREASLRTPNLFINEFSSRRLSFPTIRGVGSGQGDPAVVTYIDGVPQLTVSSTNLPLFDVERVEVLRGPHSTLYGRNALGGVIHILSKHPTATPEVHGSATFGNYGLQEYSLWGGGPIDEEDLFLRAGARYSRRDGYTKNDVTGNDIDFREAWYGRGGVLWAPTEESEISVGVYGERARDGGFVLSDLAGLRQRPHRIAQDFEGRGERDLIAPSITWKRAGEDVALTSVTAYQDWSYDETSDFDFSVVDGVRRHSLESQSYVNQEVRLESVQEDSAEGDRELRWLAGVNLFAADTSRSGATEYRPDIGVLVPPPFTPPIGTDTQRGSFDDWGVAVFGQVTVPIPAEFELGLGLRYDHEAKDADLRRTFDAGGMTVSDVSHSLSDSYDEVVPEVSLKKDLGERTMAYTRIAKGFKAGGFNLDAPTGKLAFEPETCWTWELGAKSSLLDDRLHLSAAVFYVDWEDMQLSLFDNVVGGYVDNVGEAESRGFELEARAEALEGLELFGGFGYTDATFDSYTDTYGQDVAGNTLPFVPETTWNVGGTVFLGEDRDRAWFLHAALVGVGSYYYDAGNRQKEDFKLLDLRAGVRREHWGLELWVKNALDEEYVQIAFQPSTQDPSSFVGESGAPMTLGITLSGGF